MHSLVLSQCSEIPHKLSSDIQELLCSWATICTGTSSFANIGPLTGTFLQVHFSQYTLKRSLIFKAALHVLPRQNRPGSNLNRGPLRKKKKKKKERPNHWTQWDPSASTEQFPIHPSSVSSRQDLPRSQCSLEKMSLVGRSRHDCKTQAREELWFELSHSLFPLTWCSHYPLHTCARSHQFSNTIFQIALSISRNPALWREKKTTESLKRGSQAPVPCDTSSDR